MNRRVLPASKILWVFLLALFGTRSFSGWGSSILMFTKKQGQGSTRSGDPRTVDLIPTKVT